MKKQCSKCGKKRPLEAFCPSHRARRTAVCNACEATRDTARRLADPERAKARGRVRSARRTQKDPARATFIAARSRAALAGTVFTLTLEHYRVLYASVVCTSCGGGLLHVRGGHPEAWTLDRVVPERGYVAGNVFPLCSKCNALKGNGTEADIETVLAYVRWAHSVVDAQPELRFRPMEATCP